MGHDAHIAQHWSVSDIALSYLISVTGSFCTIQLMEQWRQYEETHMKYLLLFLSAITLGGCGIWCTHFTGMTALKLVLDDGTTLDMQFEVGLTILSFIFPVSGVFVGLKIASTDPFFLEIEATRRKNILVKELANSSMKNVVNKKAVARSIKYTALFGRLWRILGGGFFAALGVLGMHYIGMSAQRTNATMELDMGIVVLSCVIAFGTANAAFWILFRAHTFWPEHEGLRVASALIMGVAVCGTHYSGMGAATYIHSAENYGETTRFTVDGSQTAVVASHVSILLCYWLTSLGVTRSVKITEAKTRSRQDDQRASQAAHAPKSEAGKIVRGTTVTALTTGTSRGKIYAANESAQPGESSPA